AVLVTLSRYFFESSRLTGQERRRSTMRSRIRKRTKRKIRSKSRTHPTPCLNPALHLALNPLPNLNLPPHLALLLSRSVRSLILWRISCRRRFRCGCTRLEPRRDDGNLDR